MKTGTALAAISFVLAASPLASCANGQGDHRRAALDPVVATLGEDGGDIVLHPGQVLYANLYLREGTGQVWRLEQADLLDPLDAQGRLVGQAGRPLPSKVGHNEVVQQFAFQARQRGEGDLVFSFGPARDPAVPPQRLATYRLHVE